MKPVLSLGVLVTLFITGGADEAPFDGIITERNFTNGDFVRSAEQGNLPPLFVLTGVDLMRVVMFVPEADSVYAERGDQVELAFPALSPNTFVTGNKIARISAANDGNQMMRVEVDVPNPKGRLREGMRAMPRSICSALRKRG